MDAWPRVAVVGPGAVGGYFGGMLARAGAAVTLVGRPGPRSAHLEAVARDGLRIEGQSVSETIAVEVADDARAVRDATLVLFCVKTVDTGHAAREIAPHLAGCAAVVSLQNGVDNVDRMRAEGVDALAAVVFVGAAVGAPGRIDHRGRGDLILGPLRPDPSPDELAAAERIAGWFERADVPCPVSERIGDELWIKLIINSMTNPIGAVTGSTYGALTAFEPTRRLAESLAREALEVAWAAGVALDADEVLDRARATAASVAGSLPSTRQDIERGRPTEIDALNGYLVRRGAELGVPTPLNEALCALVKLRERAGR